jgi:hypothetical protein
VATRAQVLELLGLGHTYETAGRALDIPAGQAFMIATGVPADGSSGPEEPEGKPALAGSPQQLVNPPSNDPARKEHVLEWVRARAARELRAESK